MDSAIEIAESVRARRVSATAVMEECLREIAAKNPRVNLSTFIGQYKPTVRKVQDEANRQFEKINLADVLQRVTLDALFSIGVCKVGLANPGQSAMRGWKMKAGTPFASAVSLDDFLFDHHARRWEDCSWIANRYRIPLWIAREMDDVAAGELLCVFTAGAYGMAMASNYNARPRPAEVLVDDRQWGIITARQMYADLVRNETPDPHWRAAP